MLDKDFLKKLDESKCREVYARITALSLKELPLEHIEGKVTGGSINIDGTSAVRRTCNLSMIAQDVNINDFYWGLHNKFKLEIGLKNDIDLNYPDIIWFSQGIYIINSFNTSLSTSGFNISISGKDKMCLLNGEVSGSLPASIDFGVEEYLDLENQTTTYKKVPIKKIIKEAVHAYALEPYHNIIINDLEESGLELLEYRGEDPLYLLCDINRQEYVQMYFNGEVECYLASNNKKITLAEIPNYNKRLDNLIDDSATEIKLLLDNTATIYTVAKIEYGQTAGYRLTDLVYAGELISNIGESITSILDKIVQILGNFEYFYDLDGRFIFQEKKNYVQTPSSPITKTDEDTYVKNAVFSDSNIYHFEGNNLITSFSNSPNLNNLKNDYSIWGTRKTVNNIEVPIHYRYAIHTKPKYYKNIAGEVFTDEDWDWREIIYQMALDYYKYNENGVETVIGEGLKKYVPLELKIRENNYDYYPSGLTGYEQFYLDVQGFWRELYNPVPIPKYINYLYKNDSNKEFIYEDELFVKEDYTQLSASSKNIDKTKVLVLKQYNGVWELQELIDTIKINYNFDVNGNQSVYYITADTNSGYKAITRDIANRIEKKEIYIFKNNTYTHILNDVALNSSCYLKNEYQDKYIAVSDLPIDIQKIYKNQNTYYKYYPVSQLDMNTAEVLPETEPEKKYFNYYTRNYNYFAEGNNKYWKKEVKESPDSLNFWLDFLDSSELFKDKDGNIYTVGSELDNYSINTIGDRSKVINDSNVKSIYFRDVPNLIFTTYQQLDSIDLKVKT